MVHHHPTRAENDVLDAGVTGQKAVSLPAWDDGASKLDAVLQLAVGLALDGNNALGPMSEPPRRADDDDDDDGTPYFVMVMVMGDGEK